MGKCVSVNSQPHDKDSENFKEIDKTQKTKNTKRKVDLIKNKKLAQKKTERNRIVYSREFSSRPAILNEKKETGIQRRATLRPSLITKQQPEAISATVSKVQPNPQAQKDIQNLLKSHFLFNMLSVDVIKKVVKEMKVIIIEPGQTIYQQGNYGNNFYVLEKGKLDVLVDNQSKSFLVPKQCFGELGLIQDTPRTTTVLTLEKSTLRAIDRECYKALLSEAYNQKDAEGVEFLQIVPLFKQLTLGQLHQVAQTAVQKRVEPGEAIIKEGETGETLYIVKDGTVHCSQNSQHVRDFHKGDYFGEQSLLYQTKRNATCTAAGKVIVLSISRVHLMNALGQDLEGTLSKNTVRIALSQNQYLKNLISSQMDMVYGKMEIKKYEAGEIVISQNTLTSAYLLVVIKGELRYGNDKFRLYDILGDEELTIENCKRTYKTDLIAESDSQIAIISRCFFEEIIGGSLKLVTQKNNLISILKQVHIFKGLPLGKLVSIASVLRIEEYPPNTLIFKQNTEGHKFYIVKSGCVDIKKDGVSVKKIGVNGFFGERSLLLDEKRTTTAVVSVNSSCWVLQKSLFLQLFDEKMREELIKRINRHEDDIDLNQLMYIKTLNKGIICKAFLVYQQETLNAYILRTINRNSIKLYNYYSRLIMEKDILRKADFPFIGSLIKIFKDSARIYFLQEFVNGQDLFDLISGWDKMGNESSRFYAAGILIILEYLHSHNIIYRDLKPENILIDEDGYPKIIDFGNSKIIDNRTYSTVGTPHYMAPEVISGKGYSFSSDYWSLGVMIYELLFNCLPFAPQAEDFYTIYQSILSDTCVFPAGNHLAKPLIEKLLVKDQNMRGSLKTIKDHSWFIGVNWDRYVSKQINSPRKPNLIDLEKEISDGQSRKMELFSRILKEESKDEVAKKNIKAPENWDIDFA